MRKQHFARLELEPLEELALPNMIWGPVPPDLFLNEAASEPLSLVGPESSSQGHNQAQFQNLISVDSSQPSPSLSFGRSAVSAHSDHQSRSISFSSQNSILFSATDDVTNPIILDFFGIDSLVASKGRATLFMGRDSLGVSAPVGSASNAPADGTGPIIPSANAGLSGGFIASPATMGLSNNQAGPATLLLPPRNSAPGSHNGAPLSPLNRPSFASGPNIGTQRGFDLVTPNFVPVNADNDNGSTVTYGIPANRDFSVRPLPINDPELISGSVTPVNLPCCGVWTTTIITNTGGGQISLWIDQKKTASFTPPGTFYVEGDHESKTVGDVTLEFEYSVGGTNWVVGAAITVTPVISSFGVTPGGGATGQNITYKNGTDGSGGLIARTPAGSSGAYFEGVLDVHAINGQAQFIQNVLSLQNGANGTKDKNGKAVGYLYQDNTGQVLIPTQMGTPGFPLLDVHQGDTTPIYDTLAHLYTVQNQIGTVIDTDEPDTGLPPNANTGIAVDFLEKFQLYLIWQFSNNNTDIYYPLAYTHWQVNFHATATNKVNNQIVPPINQINPLHGVTSDGANNYTASNETPRLHPK